jgi:hypothetical protein
MKLTIGKIEKLVSLSEACFEYLMASEPQGAYSGSGSSGTKDPNAKKTQREIRDGPRSIKNCAAFQELESLLYSLSETELREVLALIFVGCGPWPAEDFQTAFEQTLVRRDHAKEISFIAANLIASDNLAEGFEKLNRARIV